MAAMMTVGGCVYRLSRSVQARRPSRLNLNRSVSIPAILFQHHARAIEFPVPFTRSLTSSIRCSDFYARARTRFNFFAQRLNLEKHRTVSEPSQVTSGEPIMKLFTYRRV